jgi:ribosomal protein L25 (general stress protein Ctc)
MGLREILTLFVSRGMDKEARRRRNAQSLNAICYGQASALLHNIQAEASSTQTMIHGPKLSHRLCHYFEFENSGK